MDPHTKAMTTAEELRQLIREANEARADLAAQEKSAKAYLSLFTKEFLGGYEATIRSKVNEDIENAFKVIAEARDNVLAIHAEVQRQLNGVKGQIHNELAHLAGMSAEELTTIITTAGLAAFRDAMTEGMAEQINEQVKLRLAAQNRRRPGKGRR